MEALNSIDGFYLSVCVIDENGEVVTGDILYLRESIHTAIDKDGISRNSENSNYALTADHVRNAGTSPYKGTDAENYNSRIGIGMYECDLHPYQPEDLMAGKYKCMLCREAYTLMRPSS